MSSGTNEVPLLASNGSAGPVAGPSARRRAYDFLEGRTRRGGYFVNLLYGVILLNVLTGILDSVPEIEHVAGDAFNWVENVSVVLFTVECQCTVVYAYCALQRGEPLSKRWLAHGGARLV